MMSSFDTVWKSNRLGVQAVEISEAGLNMPTTGWADLLAHDLPRRNRESD